MTECERIVSQGILSKDFLKEEVRNDFLVDNNRKKLWAILIDLYLQFEEVCRKHNLKWYVMFGGALGAVRHGGFIPWDDDIDIVMPRPDYQKFMQLKEEFKQPYFLQTPYTDSEFYYSFIRLRNTNTTAINEKFRYQKMNHGIYIAIFPLDNWIKEDTKTYNKIGHLIRSNSTYMRLKNPNLDERDKEMISNYKGDNPLWVYEEIQRLSMSYADIITKHVAIPVVQIYPYSKNVFDANDFQSQRFVRFEHIEVPIPNGYENLLKQVYGDYMKFPPVEQRGVWHTGTFIDTDKPYSSYI